MQLRVHDHLEAFDMLVPEHELACSNNRPVAQHAPLMPAVDGRQRVTVVTHLSLDAQAGNVTLVVFKIAKMASLIRQAQAADLDCLVDFNQAMAKVPPFTLVYADTE